MGSRPRPAARRGAPLTRRPPVPTNERRRGVATDAITPAIVALVDPPRGPAQWAGRHGEEYARAAGADPTIRLMAATQEVTLPGSSRIWADLGSGEGAYRRGLVSRCPGRKVQD